jgi:DNA-binding XRE family transcriptional regulator
MNKATRNKLEAGGWRLGSAKDFLGLSTEEAAFIEVKLLLSDKLRERRSANRLTQAQLAKLLGSSQSRVAKMEAGDPSVSVDLLLRSLFILGATPTEVGSVLRRRRSRLAV